MEKYLSEEEIAFRDQVREFLRDNLSPALAEKSRAQLHMSKDDMKSWHLVLYQRGWAAPSWPREYGGPGWTPMQRYIFDSECAAADAPTLPAFGVSMVGPVIYTYGSAAQKARYLPRILSMEDYWCQGYSEPGAGSDLASLTTRADSVDGHYIVNGSKIWTSDAQNADMMFCLVRTSRDAKPQRGISFLLIDMRSPGITIQPIVSIDGGRSLNQVFFVDVRVPGVNLVGEENEGWSCAKFLLGHERAMSADVARSKRRLERLKQIARNETMRGKPLIDDAVFASQLAGAEIELMALEYTNMRLVLMGEGDRATLAASMMKLRGSEIMQQLTELSVDALGYTSLPYSAQDDGSHQSPGAPDYAAGRVEDYLFRRAVTIYAGSSETQRNILAKSIFGF